MTLCYLLFCWMNETYYILSINVKFIIMEFGKEVCLAFLCKLTQEFLVYFKLFCKLYNI